MLMTNTETVPGHKIISFHGVVTGSTVRAKHIGKDFLAGLKNIVGGELTGYTELLQEARQEARQEVRCLPCLFAAHQADPPSSRPGS